MIFSIVYYFHFGKKNLIMRALSTQRLVLGKNEVTYISPLLQEERCMRVPF